MALEANMGLTSEDIAKFSDQSIPETNTYAIDWYNGRLSGKISGLEAVQQYIYKTLKTECNHYLIYDAKFGSGIIPLVHQGKASREYLETYIPRLVKTALTDKRILGVHDFEFSYPDNEGDSICIKFIADTIYGTAKEEVVI